MAARRIGLGVSVRRTGPACGPGTFTGHTSVYHSCQPPCPNRLPAPCNLRHPHRLMRSVRTLGRPPPRHRPVPSFRHSGPRYRRRQAFGADHRLMPLRRTVAVVSGPPVVLHAPRVRTHRHPFRYPACSGYRLFFLTTGWPLAARCVCCVLPVGMLLEAIPRPPPWQGGGWGRVDAHRSAPPPNCFLPPGGSGITCASYHSAPAPAAPFSGLSAANAPSRARQGTRECSPPFPFEVPRRSLS